ncbi:MULTISPECIES: aspartyl-phosphate phosphatase Spo0E family protein [Gracilibacillus]|uniref:Spo0E family sporulation regulatory protein-aspartic acid phosphatase n=1 Tax=Gracilibacillus dipsosauri TaxID=178340 RepID=A0A317KVL4_9BACI|nr:aspartyl-phosphate phosphatase Spo0E family protein [Gracilibacillus dipsosauri]PWU67224.1 Spo0E family sporulation regulatory protein-aspartic acid phosphatase [Gracilibacillus dipsosauri]
MNKCDVSLLLHSMELKRKEMYDIASVEGIDSPNVIKASKELDRLISDFQYKGYPTLDCQKYIQKLR